MPLYHQNVPRTKKNLATTLGTLAESYMKGKQLGQQEAQKDIQNIIENPQLAQYVDKDKLQKQVKRGYGKGSMTGSALANALAEGATFGGQEPITKTIGDTLYQFNRNTREWEQVAQEETGTLSEMSDDEILSQWNDLTDIYTDITGELNREELKKDPLYPAISKEMKKRDLFSGKGSSTTKSTKFPKEESVKKKETTGTTAGPMRGAGEKLYSEEKTTEKEKYEIGATYNMNDGTTRRYLGNGKWSSPIKTK